MTSLLEEQVKKEIDLLNEEIDFLNEEIKLIEKKTELKKKRIQLKENQIKLKEPENKIETKEETQFTQETSPSLPSDLPALKKNVTDSDTGKQLSEKTIVEAFLKKQRCIFVHKDKTRKEILASVRTLYINTESKEKLREVFSETITNHVVEAREAGLFTSLKDFRERVKYIGDVKEDLLQVVLLFEKPIR